MKIPIVESSYIQALRDLQDTFSRKGFNCIINTRDSCVDIVDNQQHVICQVYPNQLSDSKRTNFRYVRNQSGTGQYDRIKVPAARHEYGTDSPKIKYVSAVQQNGYTYSNTVDTGTITQQLTETRDYFDNTGSYSDSHPWYGKYIYGSFNPGIDNPDEYNRWIDEMDNGEAYPFAPKNLVNVVISDHVLGINSREFQNSPYLETVKVQYKKQPVTFQDLCFENCPNLKLIVVGDIKWSYFDRRCLNDCSPELLIQYYGGEKDFDSEVFDLRFTNKPIRVQSLNDNRTWIWNPYTHRFTKY